jgi:hypothetical protein
MDGQSFLMLVYIFVLAIFVGFELITKVPIKCRIGGVHNQHHSWSCCSYLRDDKCCRRLSCYRPNAQNVQKKVR